MDPGIGLRRGTAPGTGPTAALFHPLPSRQTRPGWPRRTGLAAIETMPTLVDDPAQGGVVWAVVTLASIVATTVVVGVAVEAANSVVTAMAVMVTNFLI
jgi:hypothetical protein